MIKILQVNKLFYPVIGGVERNYIRLEKLKFVMIKRYEL